MGDDRRREGEAHAPSVLDDLVRDARNLVEGSPGLGSGAGELLDEERRTSSAAARGVGAVLDGDIIVDEHGLGRNPGGGEHLGGHHEVQTVARVVLDDEQHTGVGRHSRRGLIDLSHRRGGEDRSRRRSVQHAGSDEPGVKGFVSRTTAGDDRDLSGHRGIGTGHVVGVAMNGERLGMHCGHPGECIGNDCAGIIDELLHAWTSDS